jgi:hypothetical protein
LITFFTIMLSRFSPSARSRRGFIALAVGAGIISGGSLATVAMPISATPVSDVPIDPIYDAIEAHRKAYATMQTAFAEHGKAHEIADARSVRLISRAW